MSGEDGSCKQMFISGFLAECPARMVVVNRSSCLEFGPRVSVGIKVVKRR